jgi:hypothetical protein
MEAMMSSTERKLIGQAWAGLCADDSGVHPALPAIVELQGQSGGLPSHFFVEEVAEATVAVALLAAAALSELQGVSVGRVRLDRGHVADAVRSERYFRVDGQAAAPSFAPLSRFWATADGWVRTHANYPWHRTALVDTLGTSEDVAAVASALTELKAADVEERVVAAGGIAAEVRTLDAWQAHPQGQALADEPLIAHRMIGDSAPKPRARAGLPAAGVRVLDFTRVIAGPVCTRFLGALGADVLRLDPPSHPDLRAGVVADSLIAKRSAFVDLRRDDGARTLHDLLSRADVVVCGYRPGALDRFGLDEQSLVARYPGMVIVYLDAWGHNGPWAGRRGFDSVVQAPTGIAMGESVADHEPGALPCQLLDHGTGYLAAAAVLDGLRRQSSHGGTHVRRLSLARTAMWLTSCGRRPQHAAAPAAQSTTSDWLVELESTKGPAVAVSPPGTLGEVPLRWPNAVTGYARDAPTWPTE